MFKPYSISNQISHIFRKIEYDFKSLNDECEHPNI